jgi:rhodanese-related sulfurtransferase
MAQIDGDAFFAQFARITGALSAPSRLKLLDRLCQGEQTVEQLADAAELSLPNASRHLRQLADAGLAAVRRDPPRVYYRIADDSVLRFWFALRDLARSQLLELEHAARELIADRDGLVPMRREDLVARMEAGEVLLLDVRSEPEYAAGHIAGAVSVPLAELEARLATLPRHDEIVAYCRGPYCLLAVEAVETLRRHGLHALRLEEGFPEWKVAGLPVESARR